LASFAWLVCGFALGIGAAALSGRSTASTTRDTPSADDPLDAAGSAPRRRPRAIEREYLVRPVEACQQSDAEGERRYRVQQSRELVGLLGTQLKQVERVPQAGGSEAVLYKLIPYIEGWVDSLVRTGPDLVEEVAAELEEKMCDPSATETQIMLAARVIQRMPELGNARGFDCVVARGSEDLALWDALDAWRHGSLPATPAIAALAQTAQDERTRSRLVKWAEESAAMQNAELDESLAAPPPASGASPSAASGLPREALLAAALERAERAGDVDRQRMLAAALSDLRSGSRTDAPAAAQLEPHAAP
jgi:hypothetical protein